VDASQLSFNVKYVNRKGLRKHIGFEYDVDEDTVEDVTCEMLQNLSLREDQADDIAEKIRKALKELGLDTDRQQNTNTNGCSLPPAAAAEAAGFNMSHTPSSGACSFKGSEVTPLVVAAAAVGVPEPLLDRLTSLSHEQQNMVEQCVVEQSLLQAGAIGLRER